MAAKCELLRNVGFSTGRPLSSVQRVFAAQRLKTKVHNQTVEGVSETVPQGASGGRLTWRQRRPRQIWMAETRASAVAAFDVFLAKYQAMYPAACDCLEKDRRAALLLRLPGRTLGPPAGDQPHRSDVRHHSLTPSPAPKGCGTRRASLTMMFKLALSAQKR